MSKSPWVPLLFVWAVALVALFLAGFWFFRGATPESTTALAIAVTLYLGAMFASVYVTVRRRNAGKPPHESRP